MKMLPPKLILSTSSHPKISEDFRPSTRLVLFQIYLYALRSYVDLEIPYSLILMNWSVHLAFHIYFVYM